MNNTTEKEKLITPNLDTSSYAGPGAQLKKARLEKQLEIASIAQKLNLSPDILQKIEDDNYDKMPGVAFMRGYLRSYACLLGLDPEVITKKFNQLNIQDAPAKMPAQRIYKIKNHSMKRNLSWLSSLAAILLILVGAFWLHAEYKSKDNLTATAAANATLDNSPAISTNSDVSVSAPLTPNQQNNSAANLTTTSAAINNVTTNEAAPKTQKLAKADSKETTKHKKVDIKKPF